jgi:hypothetical protein
MHKPMLCSDLSAIKGIQGSGLASRRIRVMRVDVDTCRSHLISELKNETATTHSPADENGRFPGHLVERIH